MESVSSRQLEVVEYTKEQRQQAAAKEKATQKLNLPKEVQAFLDPEKGGVFLLPRIWNRASLVADFTKAEHFKSLAKTVVGGAIKKINALTNPVATVAASNLLEKVALHAKDGACEIVGMAVQKELESSAERKLVRGLGGQFFLLSTALAQGAIGGIPIIAAGAFFTIIVYLNSKEAEEQKKWNDELATNLDEKLENLRQRVTDKMAANSRDRVERMLLLGFGADVFDNTTYGYYKWNTGTAVYWRNKDLIQLREHVRANIDIYVNPIDLLWAAGLGKLQPGGTNLTDKQVDEMNEFLQDQVYQNLDEGVGAGDRTVPEMAFQVLPATTPAMEVRGPDFIKKRNKK